MKEQELFYLNWNILNDTESGECCSHRAFIFLSNTIQWLGYSTNISHFLYLCNLVTPHGPWTTTLDRIAFQWGWKVVLSPNVRFSFKVGGKFSGPTFPFYFVWGGPEVHSPRALVRITLGSWHYVWHDLHYTTTPLHQSNILIRLVLVILSPPVFTFYSREFQYPNLTPVPAEQRHKWLIFHIFGHKLILWQRE